MGDIGAPAACFFSSLVPTEDQLTALLAFRSLAETFPLDPRGRVRMNEKAYEIFGSPEAVELHFEPETATIGLTHRDPQASNAFPVNTPANWPQ